MTTPSLELYVDIVSPFGYIAYYTTRHTEAFKSIPIRYTPILLGGIISSTGGKTPLDIQNKRPWIEGERLRLATAFKVPIAKTLPKRFPIRTLTVQRVLWALYARKDDKDQKVLIHAIDAFYAAFWEGKRAIDTTDVVREVLAETFDAEFADSLMREAGNEDVKKGLVGETKRAVERGVFGLPWVIATDSDGQEKGFWGVDRLPNVLTFLGRRDGAEWAFRAML